MEKGTRDIPGQHNYKTCNNRQKPHWEPVPANDMGSSPAPKLMSSNSLSIPPNTRVQLTLRAYADPGILKDNL
jgi:hypothetical protein